MPNCNCRPPFPRPEPFSPLPRPGHVPDWGKWIRDRLAEKGALLAFPSASAFPDPGAQPNVYEALDTGTLYRWDGAHYQVLVDPSAANDVLEYEDRGRFPETGEHGKLYIAADTGILYRWGGEGYVALLPGKADKAVPQTAGNLATLTQDGNLADSGKKPADFANATHSHAQSDVTGLDAALAGKASKSDATLTERFSAWTFSPATIVSHGVVRTLYMGIDPETGKGFPCFDDAEWGQIHYGDSRDLADTTAQIWHGGTDETPDAEDITATRTALPGYQLGSQSDKPLASEAEAEALRNGKLDKSDVVPPSTSATTGQAAGAKATGDALLAKRDYNDLSYSEQVVVWPDEVTFPDGYTLPSGMTYRLDFNDVGTPSYIYFYDGDTYVGNGIFESELEPDGLILCYTDDIGGEPQYTWPSSVTIKQTRTTVNSKLMRDMSGGNYDTAQKILDAINGELVGKANRAANPTAGNLAALDANGNPTDSGVAKSDIEGLLFAQYYPEGNVKSASEFRDDIKYNFDTTNHTATVKPFCVTDDSDNDNSSLVERVVIPPFVDAQDNPYISDDGTKYRVVGVSSGEPSSSNANLTAIIAPSTVTSIGEHAFDRCTSLASVSLPSATSIGVGAFYVCTNLTSVDFGDTPRSSVPTLGTNAFNGVPTNCKIIVPYTQYDVWIAADGWSALPQDFVRHAEKADKPATFTTGNLAKFDANGNPTDSTIPAANVALTSDIPYSLGTPTIIDTASSETVEGETVYYAEVTLANRTANIVQVTAETPLDELRITFPAATSGKVRDFGLRVEIGTGSAALTAPALVPVAPTGETIKIENNAKEIPALADGTATAKGVTLLYFSETAPGVFVVKGEQVEEVA